MLPVQKSMSSSAAGPVWYVLRSWMPAALRLKYLQEVRLPQKDPPVQLARQGFHTVVLALIYMDGERTTEGVPPPLFHPPVP